MTQGDRNPFVVVLGIAQDGGVPHAGCTQECCRKAWTDASYQRKAACLGIVDPLSGKCWMIDATPDFKWQLHTLQHAGNGGNGNSVPMLAGILLTHGHVGHYTGLIHLEKAAMNAKEIPVYAMPRMSQLLSNHLPWKSLVEQKNIPLQPIQDHTKIPLNTKISVMPILVAHRDEWTETVGFMISISHSQILYIPDIDTWEGFDEIDELVNQADIVLVDGTFYNTKEIKGRDANKIPHPTIENSMQRFANLSTTQKSHFYFIHLNHTNPCLDENSEEHRQVLKNGFKIAREGEIIRI